MHDELILEVVAGEEETVTELVRSEMGAAAGGWIAEEFSPRFALSITCLTIITGFIILTLGRKRLAAADRIPTEEEDLAAMSDNLPTTK